MMYPSPPTKFNSHTWKVKEDPASVRSSTQRVSSESGGGLSKSENEAFPRC